MDNYATTLQQDGLHYDVELWDTAGQDQYERLRPLSYEKSDLVIILYSTNHVNSFDNVKMLWAPEIHRYLPETPIILVGTKCDLPGKVDTVTGTQTARDIGAVSFIEVSARTGHNVSELFQTAIRLSDKKVCRKCHRLECACHLRKKRHKFCVIQ